MAGMGAALGLLPATTYERLSGARFDRRVSYLVVIRRDGGEVGWSRCTSTAAPEANRYKGSRGIDEVVSAPVAQWKSSSVLRRVSGSGSGGPVGRCCGPGRSARAGYFDFRSRVYPGRTKNEVSWRVPDYHSLWVEFGIWLLRDATGRIVANA